VGIPKGASLNHVATVSIGIAFLPDREVDDPAKLLHDADHTLYRAKGSGRNTIFLAPDPSMLQNVIA
jgi:PleD family two-component response regulator